VIVRRVLLTLAVALVAAPVASADIADEQRLAARHAPVIRLVEQTEECGHGEPYQPMDVDVLFGDPTVALRGPWNRTDLVKIGAQAKDLDGLYEYHLDFPGDALSPGCDYERWSRRITEGRRPAVYAHVVRDPAHPGKLALQYWIFYAYNDWNNLHEGDWEMIQLVFDADDAREALGRDPESVGYSQHEGAERADWDDEKLEVVDGDRPVVYPAAGSHANFYDSALFVGTSAEQGVGCDDTRGPHVSIDPKVVTIPSEDEAARRAFPWIGFEGRWGELQQAFFNGPTGPNLKRQWREPIEWADGWRTRSFAVPTGGTLGTGATDFFCTAVGTGSRAVIQLARNAALMLALLVLLVVLVAFAVSRTAWRPTAPRRVARRRRWGQILSAAGRMYLDHKVLFVGIGSLLVVLGLIITLLQAAILGGFGLLGVETSGEAAGALLLLVVAVGTALTFLGLALVQAATVCALVRLDEDRSVGPLDAYRLALARSRPLLRAAGVLVLMWIVLTTTAVLIPVAVWLAVRWSLLAQTVELEGLGARAALRRSARLVRGRWLRVASLVGIGAGLALVAGPLVGALLILVSDAPLPLLNLVAGVVYAVAMPFVALTTSFVYFDARARHALEPAAEPSELPAEVGLQQL
jgi:hypothetical protein